jgi:hypothetical protein
MKNIQLPDDLYERAAEAAANDHVSVDKLVACLISEKLADWSRLEARAARGSVEKLHDVLAKVRDVAPEPADSL